MRNFTQNLTIPSQTLPLDGFSRWHQIAPFSPFCREKFRQLVRAGKAPQPVRFSERCTAYPNRELHKFFADPLNYQADGFAK
ncbi:helix-turn-helix transcriptional regulator [Undibacterium sp. Ji49W]|uniref:helix-turn-helix transcriptional regulator n=1 Tax=Undibacterium sp. Ji49W TaxID=3413040 RepID=UPI003BF05ADE